MINVKKKLIESAIDFKNEWKTPFENKISNPTVSIIVPVFFPEHLEKVVQHLQQISGFDEIILVDDSGCFNESDYFFTRKYSNIKVVYHRVNMGRPCARNTGAAFSNSEVLIFIDQDMFIDPFFINKMKEFYLVNRSMLFLGCRNTVSYEAIPKISQWITPSISTEWRVQTTVVPGLIDITALGVGNAYNNCSPNQIISIYNMTDKLRNLGVSKDKTIGFWDLPSMVVSHSMAISKYDFFRIGGFPEWIQGWGGEDIVLGFTICASHIPIYLSNCVSLQAYHKPYSGSEENKMRELKANIQQYRSWASETDSFPVFHSNEIKKRACVWE